MPFTRAADYAVRVMIHLAALPPGSRVNRQSLAELAEVPREYLSKVLQALARAQLIVAHRGAQGGFELARPGDFITMLEVVEALEGPLLLNTCLTGENACGRAWWCAAHEVWRGAQSAMVAVLRAATIGHLARRSLERRGAVEASPGGTLWS